MSDFPKFVQINEEGPREGFQFEKGPISTERKIELIDALSETGLNHIQVASFVNPNRVPGWADADEVVQRYERKPGIHYTALWLNLKGLQRAMATNRLDIEGSFSLTASPTFLARNQQRSMEDNIQQAHETIRTYKQHGIPLKRASIMAAFGCNFEGEIPHQRVLDLMQQLLDIAAEHGVKPQVFSLADTMAWATPKSIRELVGKVRERFPELTLSLHLHDTRGMGIANAYAGLGDGDLDLRLHRRRARRLPVRRAQGCRGQCLHRGPGVHAGRDGHRDRHRSRQADRGRAPGRGHRRPSAARLGEDGRQPEGAAREAALTTVIARSVATRAILDGR